MTRPPARAVPAPAAAAPALADLADAELVAALRDALRDALQDTHRDAPHDHAAYAELVRRHQRAAGAVALSLLHDAAEAEDMVQEAFLRAFRNLDLLADPARFGVWLRRITFGVCVDWLRAFRPELYRSLDALTGPDDGDARPGPDPRDPAPSALDRLERAEVAARVRAALDRLPARYRVPLTLFHVDGVSHARVAAALGVTEGTARSLVTRARRKLAALLARDPRATPVPNDPRAPAPLDVFDPAPDAAPRLLHVLNGDAVGDKLARSDLPGTLAVWADVLHEGPVPPDSGTPAWREARVRYLAAGDADGTLTYADALRMVERWDETLARHAESDEVVLWFEHDLFDQLLLARHLDWFARQRVAPRRLSLILVGEFPGVDRFVGLGQLTADQLASLLGTRQPVSGAVTDVGRRVWRAFTGRDPRAVESLARALPPLDAADVWALRYVGDALVRLLEELPAVGDGLPRTERQILRALDAGPMSPLALFPATQAQEARPFMGDWTFWRRLRGLAAGPAPLVSLDFPPSTEPRLPAGTAAITDAGRDVLAGRADWVRLDGFDRWIGGTHVHAAPGGDVAWRWDSAAGRLVAGRG